ncbi:MAG TPA: DEAD/DEAH box helicase [Longimicrobiales bacterium]|nr:DEAD/DEAH box helicase [Longimicrobiales bacterium]
MSSSQGHTARAGRPAGAGNTNAGDAVRAGTFHELGLNAELVRAIDELGFTRPTPVQADAIPPGLAGRDVLACAMTGSGKTAAFLLPILQRLKDRPAGRTRALILSPTRELAAQTHQALEDLAKHTRIRGAAIFGGVGMKPQEDAFRRGVEIIAATPGRLLDHMQYDYAKLADIEILVLDEADRMLDMGFLPDIRRVLRQLPAKARQTMMFSATMPAPILELSRSLLDNPERIAVERKQAPATGVAQALYPVPSHLKVGLLIELLQRDEIGNAIVFCRTKHRSNRLAEKLERAGFETARIHGNRSQNQRTEALAGFKSGQYRLLVATDIVARGIDVEALEHVVNFDVPNVPEDYIHRVGRTARAEATGDAFTFVSPEEETDMRAIERAVGRRIERRTVAGFDYSAKPTEKLEVPIGERIAQIRARKADERARARANAEKKAGRQAGSGQGSGSSERTAPRRRRRRGGSGRQGGSGSQSSAA